MSNTAKYLLETISPVLPNETIIKEINVANARETINGSGFPKVFIPNKVKCPLCSEMLSSVSKKRQKKSSDCTLLVTKCHTIKIEIYSKTCTTCLLMVQPETLHLGLLNIGDLNLVALDILYTMQNLIRYVYLQCVF